jgi:hypothetical protein
MSVYTINKDSTPNEIEDFYELYVESFSKLCIYNGKQIIDLSEYLNPASSQARFKEDIEYITHASGLTIHYTQHNDDLITSISFIEIDNITNCYAIVKFLCGNIETKETKINGKSQGYYMLDYIFESYKDYIILIEPATLDLVPYYTKYKKPNFPYGGHKIKETFGFLVYGNLTRLNEVCFAKIFNSIRIIKRLEEKLQFSSLHDLYSKTNDLESLKHKLQLKLNFLIRTKQIESTKYHEINNIISNINYYDIDELIIESSTFGIESMKNLSARGGKKKSRKSRKSRKLKLKKYIKSIKKH